MCMDRYNKSDFYMKNNFCMCVFVIDDSIGSRLPWPITDPSKPGVLLVHGPHCVQILQKLKENGTKDDVEIMHKDHCERLVLRVLLFLQTNKNFKSVPT